MLNAAQFDQQKPVTNFSLTYASNSMLQIQVCHSVGANHDNYSFTYSQLIALTNSVKLELLMFFDDVLTYYRQKKREQGEEYSTGRFNYCSEIYLAFTKDYPQGVKEH